MKGLDAAFERERELVGVVRGLGCSCVFDVKALIRVEILGLTPLTEEKAEEDDDEGESVGVVTGDEERSPEPGGWRVFPLSLIEEEAEEEEGALVRRSKLVIDCIGDGGIRCISLAGSVCEFTVFFCDGLLLPSGLSSSLLLPLLLLLLPPPLLITFLSLLSSPC